MAYAYPKVQLITTAVDPGVNEHFHIVPGIGRCLSVTALVAVKVSVDSYFMKRFSKVYDARNEITLSVISRNATCWLYLYSDMWCFCFRYILTHAFLLVYDAIKVNLCYSSV